MAVAAAESRAMYGEEAVDVSRKYELASSVLGDGGAEGGGHGNDQGSNRGVLVAGEHYTADEDLSLIHI